MKRWLTATSFTNKNSQWRYLFLGIFPPFWILHLVQFAKFLEVFHSQGQPDYCNQTSEPREPRVSRPVAQRAVRPVGQWHVPTVLSLDVLEQPGSQVKPGSLFKDVTSDFRPWHNFRSWQKSAMKILPDAHSSEVRTHQRSLSIQITRFHLSKTIQFAYPGCQRIRADFHWQGAIIVLQVDGDGGLDPDGIYEGDD